jgi:hypothetical protein
MAATLSSSRIESMPSSAPTSISFTSTIGSIDGRPNSSA